MKKAFKTISKILFILYFTFYILNSSISFAEPFYFHPNLLNQIKNEVSKINTFWNKILFLDDIVKKIGYIDQEKKDLIIRDILTYKKDLIWLNLNDYIRDKYLSWTWANDFIKEAKKVYQIVKIKDIKADTHPNYLNSVFKKLKNNSIDLDEKSNTFKLYSYLLYSISKTDKKLFISTSKKLETLEYFSSSSEFNANYWYYLNKFEKLKKLEKINPLSKNDFSRIISKIRNENISPQSDYVKWFFGWYAINKKILTNDLITIPWNINHTKQLYSLSCEANSTSDLLNFYLNSKWIKIDENSILNQLSSFSWAISKDSSWALVWADPNEVFVWSVIGKQSTNLNKFSWYWVYSWPLLKIINSNLIAYDLIANKSIFSEKIVMDSILQWNPLIFWYLTPVIKWKWFSYETSPIIWKTENWKYIKWYLGEHTWVITWFDIWKNGNIENIYFYEWKTNDMQKMNFIEALKNANYFNETIIVSKKNLWINNIAIIR